MAHLSLAFLGTPDVRHDDRPVNVRTRKALALLFYLAVEDGMHSREKLTALFWPESDHSSGRASLRTALNRLRSAIAHPDDSTAVPHLLVERDALGFNRDADHTLDLHVLEHAQSLLSSSPTPSKCEQIRADLEHYRGDFLEGFSLPDAPAFDEWASLQRERWHLYASELFDRLSQAQSTQGATSDAIATAQHWRVVDPLNERVYQRLMRLQLAQGDRTGAQQTYEACKRMLDEELGVPPAPETEALAARLHEPPPSRPPAMPRPLHEEAQRLPELHLVGREREHARLVELFHHAREGAAPVVVIEGEAGIGKTQLATTFLRWADAQGATVLQGKAFESGGRLPYQPIVEMLRSAAPPRHPRTSAPPHLRSLAPVWLAELSRILPDLREHYPDLPAPTSDESTARSRLFEAVARLGEAMAERAPLLLFLDDVQWADSATLDLLSYACRRWREHDVPIMCLFAVRAEELVTVAGIPARPILTDWLANLERDLAPVRLSLGSLTEADTQRLIERLMGEDTTPAFVHWLFDETQGQPFYITETLKALLEEGVLQTRRERTERRLTLADATVFEQGQSFVPPGVREVVRSRLARLSSTGFRLLVAGAVLDHGFTFRDLCGVAGTDTEDGLSALDEVVAMRLLVERAQQEGSPYLFAHDKIRDVVYTEAGDARRRLFHERALHYLQERGTPAARLAHHAILAGSPAPAFQFSVAAGDEAMAVFAVRDAIAQYEQAHQLLSDNPGLARQVALDQQRHLLERLGRAHELIDEWEQARAVYEEMLRLAEQQGRAEMEVAARNRLAGVAVNRDMDFDGARQILDRARHVAERAGDVIGQAEAEWRLAQACQFSGRRADAGVHGERALTLARRAGHRELTAHALNALAYANDGVVPLDQLTAARRYAEEAYRLYSELGNRAMATDSLAMTGIPWIHAGDPRAALPPLREALSRSREIGNLWGEASNALYVAMALLESGEYGEAQERAEQAVSMARENGIVWLLGGALMVRGAVYCALGAFVSALDDHLEGDTCMAATRNPFVEHAFAASLCADYLLAGRWEQAHHHAARVLSTPDPFILFSGRVVWTVVAALLHAGEREQARTVTQRLDHTIGDNPRYSIPLRRSRALLAEHEGQIEPALTELRAALDTAEELGLPGEQWHLLLELARLYAMHGEAETAQICRDCADVVLRALAGTIEDQALRVAFRDESIEKHSHLKD